MLAELCRSVTIPSASVPVCSEFETDKRSRVKVVETTRQRMSPRRSRKVLLFGNFGHSLQNDPLPPARPHCEIPQSPPYLGVGLCELRSRLLGRRIARFHSLRPTYTDFSERFHKC